MPKVILLSYFPLPYSGIGSWTTMYNYYLNTNHKIDYIVSPKPASKSTNVEYSIVKDMRLNNRIKRKIFNKRYSAYIDAIKDIVKPDTKYVIQVIENFGIISNLNSLIEETYKKSNFYIQFFYHGFAPYYGNPKGKAFFKQIDEFVLLTNDAYQAHLAYYSEFACRCSVLHNGIDKKAFHPLPINEKNKLKASLQAEGKTIFLWCSQDRPKKGLDFILDVWKRIYKKHDDIVLWVIGVSRDINIEGVRSFGRIPNAEISKYYQAASIYLFPSLWMEGFGLTLIEALLTGNLCIASNNGGIPEVLNYGEYGELIERPNFIEEWEQAIDKALNNNAYKEKIKEINVPEAAYSLDVWCANMNKKIEDAKLNLT